MDTEQDCIAQVDTEHNDAVQDGVEQDIGQIGIDSNDTEQGYVDQGDTDHQQVDHERIEQKDSVAEKTWNSRQE